MNIYERVKEMCDTQNISISKLEKELNISNGAISKWATNMPRANILHDVAKYFGTSVEYFLTGAVAPVAQELTENEKEILELLHRFDERTQLKFLGRVEAIAKEMVDDTAPKTPQSPYNTQGLNRKKELYMDKNYKVLFEGNNGRNKPSTPPPTHSTNKGDKNRNPSSSVPPAKK